MGDILHTSLFSIQFDEFWESLIEIIPRVYSYSFIALLLILYLLSRIGKRIFHSHWNTLIENFEFSSKDFYYKVKKELLSNGISGITSSYVQLSEGAIFSPKRRYVRLHWKNHQYDICAAPFGNGFFVSWWLQYKITIGQILINLIPFVGGWLVRKLYPTTFYKIDTASMFQHYCHQSVLKVIQDITDGKGIRVMTEDEKKPIMRDIFKR